VIAVESRLAAETPELVELNKQLARNICRIAVMRGFRPRASHLFYTQFLNDLEPNERSLGIELGLQDVFEAKTAWFVLRDEEILSRGMLQALERHTTEGRSIRYFRTSDNGITIREVVNFYTGDQGAKQDSTQP
jgi:hypothetical protein